MNDAPQAENSTEPTARFSDPAGGFYHRQSSRRVGVEVFIVLAVLGGIVWGIKLAAEPVAKKIVTWVPISVDMKIGDLAASAVKQASPTATSAPSRARVEAVFHELLASVPDDLRDPVETATLTILRDETPNAFALPGGPVFILTGLLTREGFDDDALRGVLAHELGHAVFRHGLQKLVHQKVFGTVMAYVFGDLQNIEHLLTSEAANLIGLSYSRSMEEEADDFALTLAKKGGWSIEPLARFFESLPNAGPGPWSTHPSPDARAKRLREKAEGR